MKIKHLLAWKLTATLLHCEYNVCYYNTSFVEDRLSGFRNAEPKLIITGTHGIKTGPKKDVAFIWRLFIYVGRQGGGWWSTRMLSGDVEIQPVLLWWHLSVICDTRPQLSGVNQSKLSYSQNALSSLSC